MIQQRCPLGMKMAIVYAVAFFPVLNTLTYDLGLIDEKQVVQDGVESCRNAGYDGLAAAATPEAYTYARAFSYDKWKNDGGVYIGLTFMPEDLPRWEDGTLAASDTPWGWEDPPAETSQPLYARITRVGKIRLFDGSQRRSALCGKYTKSEVKEITGTSVDGYHPNDARSILAETSASSFLDCVTLCGQTKECRAATFNFELQGCTVFGPGNNTLLEPNKLVKTFLRIGFLPDSEV